MEYSVVLTSPDIDPREREVPVQLPEKLQRQFGILERRLWRIETVEATTAGVGALVTSYLGVFGSDRLWDTPGLVRGAMFGIGVAMVGWVAVRWAGRWIWRRRDLRDYAVIVQRRFRRLGDRLLGIVELAGEKQHQTFFSPELYRAAIEQVTADAAPYSFAEAVDAKLARRLAGGAAAVTVVAIIAVLVIPEAAGNALARWAIPFGSIPRYTMVRIDELKAEQIVAHGEKFLISARVGYRSFWRPKFASARVGFQAPLQGEVRGSLVEFEVPGQTREDKLIVKLGDATASVKILPTHRPSLKDLTATVELPAYLKQPAVQQPVQQGNFEIVEGASASFTGTATRELASARMKRMDAAEVSLSVDGAKFTTAQESAEGVVELSWRDSLGLDVAAPWKLTIESRKDLPPIPELIESPREIAMLETEVVNLKAQARDDFGVRDLGLSWVATGEWAQTNSALKTGFKAEAATTSERKFAESFGFSPSLMKIPADSVVELKVFARDYFPNREPSESAVYRIRVLGNERHAEMVRQQLEALQARLEEVTRLEEKIADVTREMKDLPKDDLAADKLNERLEALKDDQAQNVSNLEELAREGSKALREAMRNPLVPEDTLREWSKNLQQMQKLAKSELKQATDSLKKARKSPESRQQDLADAHEKEQDALQELEQMQKKMNKSMDDLQAMTLAQRLRKLGSGQKDLAGRIQKNLGETVGLLPKELPPRIQRANDLMSGDEGAAQQEAKTLQGEISRFFERTQKAEYGTVDKEMSGARTNEELERVKGLILENIGMEAMQNLASWSERFDAWANALEPKRKDAEAASAPGSGEGGEDPMAEKLLKTLLGLLRLREGEVNLREQTRLLDQRQEDAPLYVFNADLLNGRERESMHELFRLQKGVPIAVLQQVFLDSFSSMKSVETFLTKPDTGVPTRAAETKTIELITDAINIINEQVQQQGGQSGSSSSAMEEVAFLMQMMAQSGNQQMSMMDKGKSGGGSQAGGSTDQKPGSGDGDATGKGAERRAVQKATGFSGQVPTEFREALESYFNALEAQGE